MNYGPAPSFGPGPGGPGGFGGPGGPNVMDPHSLPSDDNVNAYTFCVELKGSQWFLQKGKMIAYYGRIEFNGIGHGRFDRLLRTSFHSPLHAADWVVAEGSGKMLLADRAFDVNSYDLDNGNLTIRSGNLLAYQPTLALKQSIVPGFLTLIGTGKFVAASNGPVVFMEPPLRVDPQALVGWADCPSPCHHYDHGYMQGIMGGVRGWRASAALPARSTSSSSWGRARCCSSRPRRSWPSSRSVRCTPSRGSRGTTRRRWGSSRAGSSGYPGCRGSWGTCSAASVCDR